MSRLPEEPAALARAAPSPASAHHLSDVRIVLGTTAGLEVSEPGDPLELEADRMAGEVMSSGDVGAQERPKIVRPGRRSIQRAPDGPDPSPPTPDAGTASPLAGSSGAGSTTILDPALGFDVYHGGTLKEIADALPTESGSLTFDISTATDGDPITRATVTVKQEMRLPKWAERDKQCRPVQTAWDSFMSALRVHEDGHVAVNRRELGSAHTQYAGKPAADTQTVTGSLEQKATAAGNAFDTQTDHGRNASPPTTIDLAAKCADAGTATAEDAGTAVAENEPEAPESPDAAAVQTKLEVSQPGDPDEEEADRVAEQVMRMEAPRDLQVSGGVRVARRIQRCAACEDAEARAKVDGSVPEKCAECDAKEREEKVSRKEASARRVVDASSQVVDVAKSGGQPLDADTRAFMEPRFGFDFSRVRVHTESRASDAAERVSARAYTVGDHVVFGAGEYSPQTDGGMRLLAHELTHVVQQSEGIVAKSPGESRRPFIQRQTAAPTPATPADGDKTPAKEVPSTYRVQHKLSRLNFNDNPAEVRTTLEQFVDERDSSGALELFESEAEYLQPTLLGSPILHCDLDGQTCENHRRKVIQLVKQEVKDLKSRMADFKEYFQRRGNDALNLLLADSEAKINAEKERYGLHKEEGTFSWLVGADYHMGNTEDLTKAAKRLEQLYGAIKSAADEVKQCTGLGGTLPPGGVDAMCSPEEQKQKEQLLTDKQKEYSLARKEEEGKFPILLTYDLDPSKEHTPGVLATLASDSSTAKAKMLNEDVETKLKNIQTTREHAADHKDMIWKLPAVTGATKNLADVAAYDKLKGDGLRKVVIDDAQTHVMLAQLIEGAAIAAIAVGIGLLVAPLSAAGLAVAATAATGADAGIGVALLLKAFQQYNVEEAATNTDLEGKARSISQEEPSLLWLALEIVLTVVQVRQAATQFRNIVRLSRAAQAAKVAKQEGAAKKLLDELKSAGEEVKPGTGERLVREAEEVSSSAAQDAGEISANIENAQKSSMPGYTHEIPLDGERFWRRMPGGQWCLFASPPRCPLGVFDNILSPWLSGLSEETHAELLNFRYIRKMAVLDPRVGVLLEKYGVDAVKALENMRLQGGLPGLEILQKFDALNGSVKGAEQLLKDLAAGSSTTRGAVGEISYIDRLLEDGFTIERVADWINGKKAADIILKDGSIIDVKYYDWAHWRWSVPSAVQKSTEKMVEQVMLRKAQYPGRSIVYVFGGTTEEIPVAVKQALQDAGATAKGAI